jgi:hypothetical protein
VNESDDKATGYMQPPNDSTLGVGSGMPGNRVLDSNRLRKLPKNVIGFPKLVLDCFLAVLPWSFVVGAPCYYAIGTGAGMVLWYYFGQWIGLGYMLILWSPMAVVVYRAIKRDDRTQFSKYVDRWEGTIEQQEQALDFLIESKKKE